MIWKDLEDKTQKGGEKRSADHDMKKKKHLEEKRNNKKRVG
jgi:hypothetical protein